MIEENLIKPKTKIGLTSFLDLMNKWRNDLNNKQLSSRQIIQIVLDESGYSSMLKIKKILKMKIDLEQKNFYAMKEFDN